jgi:hypothetical protein
MRCFLWIGFLMVTLVSRAQEQVPPKTFEYPPSRTIIVIKKPLDASSLSGSVSDPTGCPVEKVLVEIVDERDKRRVDARLTNQKGTFLFPKERKGRYVLRLSKPGFDTMLVTVVVQKGSENKRVTLQLELSS